jgi:hypothetical protein
MREYTGVIVFVLLIVIFLSYLVGYSAGNRLEGFYADQLKNVQIVRVGE